MGAVVSFANRIGLLRAKITEGSFDKIGKSFYDLSVNTLKGEPFDFNQVKGKVVLVVNVACLCGFTKGNYQQLVALDEKYAGKLAIMAFPTNDFDQELKTPQEILDFVDMYGVKFHMMEVIHVNGPDTHPMYTALKEVTSKDDIKWNFETKFLVGTDGKKVDRFSRMYDSSYLAPFIDKMLENK